LPALLLVLLLTRLLHCLHPQPLLLLLASLSLLLH
jgi:hypothetical protein